MKRVDGRGPSDLRPVKITGDFVPTAEGSVLFEQGNTRVICTASVEDKVPQFLKGSGSGWITAEYAMLPRATADRSPRESVAGKIGGRTHEISRMIGRSLRSVVDLTRLKEKTLWLDCDVIQADGGTRCAAITGAFVACRQALDRLYESGQIEKRVDPEPVAAVSVGIVAEHILLDLCYEEDVRAEVDMNVVMTGAGKIVEVQGTAEQEPFSLDQLSELLGLAGAGIDELMVAQASEDATPTGSG
ncbi:MAG: ribonuclease PH [Terriglobia bacterium]